MERLTSEINGRAVPIKFDLDFAFDMPQHDWSGLQEMFDRLAAYEETRLEPEEIERFRQAAGVNCKTILVRRPTLEQARGQLGNRSDDGVAAYTYDAEFLNDGSLEELPAKVHDFLQALIKR